MSRATMKSKWKIHGSFRTQRKAEKVYEALQASYPDSTFCMMIRQFSNKDKRRYQVKELIRKGRKPNERKKV